MRRVKPKAPAALAVARKVRCYYDHIKQVSKISYGDDYADLLTVYENQADDLKRQFLWRMPPASAFGCALSDAWKKNGADIYVIDQHVQDVFYNTPLKPLSREELILPAPCTYFALSQNTEIKTRDPQTGMHTVAGFYIYDLEADPYRIIDLYDVDLGIQRKKGIVIMAWATANFNSFGVGDDSVQYFPMAWPADSNRVDLERLVKKYNKFVDAKFKDPESRKLQVTNYLEVGTALMRIGVNAALYMRYCVEDAGPPVDLAPARKEVLTKSLKDGLAKRKADRFKRQLATLGSARRIYQVAPELSKQHRQRKEQSVRGARAPLAKRSAYEVNGHFKWVRYGPMKDADGMLIPKHERKARLTYVKGYKVKELNREEN